MIATPTKYPNTSRVISGQVNLVFDSDLILLCDTSLGAVELLLLEIPENHFNTQYKLYVVDNSNNAVNNNITIKAPTGFTVQGSNTAKITSNGGVCIVTISSNKSYSAFFSYNEQGNPIVVKNEGSNITPNATSFNFVGQNVEATANGTDVTVTVTSSGNPIVVKNEGVEITPQALSLNFVGNLVNASSVAGAVQVDINSSFLTVTYAVLQNLISTNALIPNQNYLITNAIFTSTFQQNYTYTNTVNIIVKAISTNEVSLSGSGIFLNADYQNVGNYSGVSGFQAQQGVWYQNAGYGIGDVIIWQNLHWKCIVSNSGANPSNYPQNWELLPQNATNGYITEIDIIKYDIATNFITYREDVRNNKIENNLNRQGDELEAFYFYQWGNNNCSHNTISDNSLFVCWNSLAQIRNNTISTRSAVYVSENTTFGGYVQNNIFSNYTSFSFNNTGDFNNNVIVNNSCSITNSGSFENNNLKNCNGSIENQSSFQGNTFHKQLEFSNGLTVVNAYIMLGNQFIDFDTIEIQNRSYDGLNGFFNDNVGTQNCRLTVNDSLGAIRRNRFCNCVVRLNGQWVGSFNDNTITGTSSDYSQSVVLGDLTNNYSTNFSQNTLINSFIGLDFPSDEIKFNNLENSYFTSNASTQKITSNSFKNFKFTLFLNNTAQGSLPLFKNTVIHDVYTFIEDQLFDDLEGGVCQGGINTLKTSLDMDNPLIYDVVNKSLIIPINFKFLFGEYSLKSNTNFDIEFISNLNTNFTTKFTNAQNINFPNNAKRFVVLPLDPFGLSLNQLLSPNSPVSTSTTYFTLNPNNAQNSFPDNINIRSSGNYNGIEAYYQYVWNFFA